MISVDKFESYTEKGRDLLESVLPEKYARVAEALETIADTIFEELTAVVSEAQPEPVVETDLEELTRKLDSLLAHQKISRMDYNLAGTNLMLHRHWIREQFEQAGL